MRKIFVTIMNFINEFRFSKLNNFLNIYGNEFKYIFWITFILQIVSTQIMNLLIGYKITFDNMNLYLKYEWLNKLLFDINIDWFYLIMIYAFVRRFLK